MSGDERTNGNPNALAFWEPRSNDSEPEMLVFGTGERIAVTDRVFKGEAGALLLKLKREADALIAEAARQQAEIERRQAAYDLDMRAKAYWRALPDGSVSLQ